MEYASQMEADGVGEAHPCGYVFLDRCDGENARIN